MTASGKGRRRPHTKQEVLIRLLNLVNQFGQEGCNHNTIFNHLKPSTSWDKVGEYLKELAESKLLEVLDHSAGVQGSKAYRVTEEGGAFLQRYREMSVHPHWRLVLPSPPDQD